MAGITANNTSSSPNLEIFSPNFNRRPDVKTYRQLNSSRREIRLLRIWKQSGEVHATIQHASLDDEPAYKALSYCWGPPSTLRAIHLDGHLVLISKTLFKFLKTLCSNGQSPPIWVDQLCIDQANVIERNSQVAMMGDIYRSATGVLTWLGSPDVDIEYAMAYINAISKHGVQDTPAVRQLAEEGLKQIRERPYWRRMWILQEVGLAKFLTIRCGNYEVEFGDLYSILARFDLHQNIEALYDLHQTLRSAVTETQNKGQHLVEQSITFRHQLCEDKRDRFYALRSLSNDGPHVVVDYSKTIYEVLWDVLRSWTNHSRCVRSIDSWFDFEPFPSLMSSLELSVEDVLESASGLSEPVFSFWHSGSIDNGLELERDSTGTDGAFSPSAWPVSVHASALLASTSQYAVFYADHCATNSYRYYRLSQEYDPTTSLVLFDSLGSVREWEPYLIQAHEGQLKIVGIGYRSQYAHHQDWEDKFSAGRYRSKLKRYRLIVSLFLLLKGHIQCCRYSVMPSCGTYRDKLGVLEVKLHYSLYAFLSLCATTGEWRARTTRFLDPNLMNLPMYSLCNCDSETASEDSRA